MSSKRKQKAIFFDLMGTCCDWLSSLLPLLHALPPHPSLPSRTSLQILALAWRAAFFSEIHLRHSHGDPAEDIDITHRRVLDLLLSEKGIGLDVWDEETRQKLVAQWHSQVAWPDVIPALQKLREDENTTWFLVVLANGTTRLQLDIASSSGIPFHMLMSSELLGLTKPDPAIYRKAMDLVRLPPEDCVMLASHLYDLEAAKGVGMKTIYIHRSTEDAGIPIQREKMPDEHPYVDVYFDGREGKRGFGDAVDQCLMDESSWEDC